MSFNSDVKGTTGEFNRARAPTHARPHHACTSSTCHREHRRYPPALHPPTPASAHGARSTEHGARAPSCGQGGDAGGAAQPHGCPAERAALGPRGGLRGQQYRIVMLDAARRTFHVECRRAAGRGSSTTSMTRGEEASAAIGRALAGDARARGTRASDTVFRHAVGATARASL